MEREQCLPEDVTEEQILYHVQRLRNSCNLLRTLDSGDYPLPFYTSGETELKRDAKGQLLVDKDHHPIKVPVALPIFGTTPRDTHCLSFAVKSAISADFDLLSEWGGHEDAMEMINETKLFPKNGTIYARKP